MTLMLIVYLIIRQKQGGGHFVDSATGLLYIKAKICLTTVKSLLVCWWKVV